SHPGAGERDRSGREQVIRCARAPTRERKVKWGATKISAPQCRLLVYLQFDRRPAQHEGLALGGNWVFADAGRFTPQLLFEFLHGYGKGLSFWSFGRKLH